MNSVTDHALLMIRNSWVSIPNEKLFWGKQSSLKYTNKTFWNGLLLKEKSKLLNIYFVFMMKKKNKHCFTFFLSFSFSSIGNYKQMKAVKLFIIYSSFWARMIDLRKTVHKHTLNREFVLVCLHNYWSIIFLKLYSQILKSSLCFSIDRNLCK